MIRLPTLRGVLVLSCIVVSLCGCGDASDSYYPLTEGMTWEYEWHVGSRNMTVTITNLPSRDLEGLTVTPQKVQFEEGSAFHFVAEDESGVYIMARQPPTSAEPEILTAPEYLLRYPIQAKDSWIHEEQPSLVGVQVDIALINTVESVNEVVTVPAGTFENCIRVHATGTATKELGGFYGSSEIRIESTTWFAPGVGLVKSHRTETSGHLLVGSGEETIQLIAAGT